MIIVMSDFVIRELRKKKMTIYVGIIKNLMKNQDILKRQSPESPKRTENNKIITGPFLCIH